MTAGSLPAMEMVPPVLPPAEGNEIDGVPLGGSEQDGMQWMLMPGANGEVHVAVLSAQPMMEAAHRLIRPSDVEFFLYTR